VPSASHDGPGLFPLGPTTVTFTGTDAAGNTAQCQATVTVIDTVAPELTSGEVGLPAIELEATAALTPFTPPQSAFTELVGPLTVIVSPAGPYPLGNTSLLWIASDGAGNQLRLRQQLSIRDTTAPLYGLQPPLPVQEAINGYANPVNYVIHGVYEAVELARDVSCMPAPGATASSGDFLISCQVMDTSSNFSRLQIPYSIVQSDDDTDGISNIVDPTPATDDGSGQFSDIPLGGSTAGRIVDASGYDIKVEDAYLEEHGVRVEATALAVVTSRSSAKLKGPASSKGVELQVCGNQLQISGLREGVDAGGNPGPAVAVIACEPLTAIAETGSLSLTLPGPNGGSAHVHLDSGNGISWDGRFYRAPDSNTDDVTITTPAGQITVGVGQAVVGLQVFGIPATSFWGMFGLLILLGGIAVQELRRRG